MEAVILTVLGLMGTWNVAVTIWVLRWRRNNHKSGNPHPLPCEEHGKALKRIETTSRPCGEHGRALARIETAIEKARTEAGNSHRDMRRDLVGTQKTVSVLWHKAFPGQSEPNKR